jgi:phthalate 4,5-dioxygenase reductase subunit
MLFLNLWELTKIMKTNKIKVKITTKREIANQLFFFELTSVDTPVLPQANPGDYIAVETPSKDNRHYSIASTSKDGKSYCLVIKREPEGRGGSISMADNTKKGDELYISEPENEFSFVEGDEHLLIAGGIGITPIFSMFEYLVKLKHKRFKLIYLTKSEDDAVFLDKLIDNDNVHIHYSKEGRFDFWDLLMTPSEKHIYCCGPKSLISEIKDMTGHWPARLVHFEDFNPVEAIRADDKAFTVRVKSSGEVITVSEKETMIHALRNKGYQVNSSCESGTCGSCKVTHLSGIVDHRDLALDDDERKRSLLACVSRSTGDEILLDI